MRRMLFFGQDPSGSMLPVVRGVSSDQLVNKGEIPDVECYKMVVVLTDGLPSKLSPEVVKLLIPMLSNGENVVDFEEIKRILKNNSGVAK